MNDKNGKLADKLSIDPKDIDNTYSEPNPERDKIRNLVLKASALGLGVGAIYGICNGLSDNAYSQETITELTEKETTVDNQTETTPESDENGFSGEFSEYTVQPGDSYGRIAEIICASANIKPDPEIIEVIEEYLADINNKDGSQIIAGNVLNIPAYLTQEFKKANNAEQALPEADAPLRSSGESDQDYFNQVGVIIPDNGSAIQVHDGQKVIDVARQIPGFSEIEKAFPNLAKQVLDDIAEKNRGMFNTDGSVYKSDFVIVPDYVGLNNPNLAVYIN